MLSKNIPPGAFVIGKHPDGKFIRPRAKYAQRPVFRELPPLTVNADY
jgi:hypothetical protein